MADVGPPTPIANLYRRTLGLVGLGRIGRCVAERARAFGMKVQYHDVVRTAGFDFVSFDELLATSDIVSLHAPLTPATNRLMGAKQFVAMKPGAILINAARGELTASFTDRLKKGNMLGGWCTFTSFASTEIMAGLGYDFLKCALPVSPSA